MQPLVTIVVITYNTQDFVLETLESIRKQTYPNIELIISDDGSKDETVSLCNNWLQANSHFFVHTKLITTEQNGGIPANCNRGIKAASGEWVKLIAGDDVLEPDCITDNVNFALSGTEIEAIHSESAYYEDTFEEKNFLQIKNIKDEKFNRQGISVQNQLILLLQGCYVNTPTVFMKRGLFKKFGYYDESIRTVEDWPMWIKLSKNGVKFHYLPMVTVRYRVHNRSVTNRGKDTAMFTKQQDTEWQVHEKYILKELPPLRRNLEILEHRRIGILKKLGFTKRTLAARLLNYITFKPLDYFRKKVKKRETEHI